VASETRRRILATALACFLEEGYEQSTVAHIRKRSGVSNGALFHYFRSKEAIADTLYVEAMASFHEGLWELIRSRPRSLRAAVGGTIEHQLDWIERHADLARFIYMRGHLDWESPASAELATLNRDLESAFREWMAPLVERGEIRPTSMLVITALVNGPAHALARRWLAGQIASPPRTYADELTDAACAALRGTRVRAAKSQPPVAQQGHVTLELLSDDGRILSRGRATAELVPLATAGAAGG
jgi:AcrR family transcriptional regulator